jgi:hypothetical protein
MASKVFGFQFVTNQDSVSNTNPQAITQKTFALPPNEDGAVTIQSGAYYGTYVDLDGAVRNEIELITRYREMSTQAELEKAIDEIVNEAVIMEDSGHSVDIVTDELSVGAPIKKKIMDEFKYILKMLDFGNTGHEIFRRWYIDGRLFYHVIIDETKPDQGIKEIRYIDPRRIRKIREVQKTKDGASGMDIIRSTKEYYLYNDRGIMGTHSNLGMKISPDSIVNVNSGMMDSKRTMVLSYLHKAIKPLNQLRMMEDATVIYRLSRAPERRIFYVDVGQMSTIKSEQYLRDIMVKYRNKLVYDSATGEIRDDRRHLSMLEDIWLPRREGSKGTEIDTLPGGQNLGKMEDVEYFNKKLYESLGVPKSRLEQSTGFTLGRSTEITRDELNFAKFIQRLRNKFSGLFDELLRRQLALKKIASTKEWEDFKESIWYDFKKDNNFEELKEAELLTNRAQLLQMLDPYVGTYLSREYIYKHVLRFTDDEIEEIQEQITSETPPTPQVPMDQNGQPLPLDQNGQPMAIPGQPPGLPGQPQQQALPPPSGPQGQSNPLQNQSQQRFTNDTLELKRK